MSEPRSALPGARFDGRTTVAEAGLRGMITLKGDLAAAPLKNVCTSLTGLDFPGEREANCVGENGLCWMAPDELLLFVPYDRAAHDLRVIDDALKGTHYLATNVSDARAVFTVSGFEARDTLAKLTPADLHPDSFQPGQLRRTRLAQVPCAFWMHDSDTFEVIVFRSVAQYAFDLLANAAAPSQPVGYT